MSATVGSIYQAPDGGTALLNGVTNSGTVFGAQGSNGYIATANGAVTLLAFPGASSTTVLGLNSSGQAGYGEATVGTTTTYFTIDNGVLTPLPAGSVPMGVDDAGDVLIDMSQSSFLLGDGVATPVQGAGAGSIATAISPGGVLAGSIGSDYFVETANRTVTYSNPFIYDGREYTVPGAPKVVNDAGTFAISTYFPGGYAAVVQNGEVVSSFNDPHGDPVVTGLTDAGLASISDFNGFGDQGRLPILGASSNLILVSVPGLLGIVDGQISDSGEIVGYGVTFSGGEEGFTAELPCFVAGTLIATAEGERPVEQLRAGDLVRTKDGALRPVTWTGGRVVDLDAHPDPALARPVVVRAGVFGAGLPRRDLALSPDHAIASGEVLIPAKCLVDGVAVVVDERARVVSYHHVELAEHDLLLAEGLAVESFLDTGNRLALMPGAAAPIDLATAPDRAWFEWEARGCRRLVLAGPELEAARAKLQTIPA